MDSTNWLVDFVAGFPLWALGIAISAAFFREDRNSGYRKVASAAHGAVAALAFGYAAVTSAFTVGATRDSVRLLELVLWFLLALSCASLVASLVWFRGRRRFLLLHLMTVPIILAVLLFGGMMVANSWP